MALASKTIRLFVSSTFSDLKEERNALYENVFPELRKLCMEHGFRFQAIDLRWGISKEASLSQETMRICLQEIKRCQTITPRPNFVILLGERFGWQPLPEEISGTEFDQIKQVIKKRKKDFDGIAGEFSTLNAEELLDRWYKEDKNAVPPMYILQPVDPMSKYIEFELRENEVQQPLLKILRGAIQDLNLSFDEKLKYQASATQQEIELGAMKVEDADEHVFAFFRRIKNLDELKKINHSNTTIGDFIDTDIEDKFDENAYKKILSLKDRLEKKLGKKNVTSYEVEWKKDGITTDHINNLCRDVYDNLSSIILKKIDQMQEKDPLENEADAQEDFRRDRAKHFIGRVEMLNKIARYIDGENTMPFAIHGKSGTGKSALLAFSADKAKEDFPEANIVFRSIGATPTSSEGRSLLESLCLQISNIHSAEKTEIPGDYEGLSKEFPKRLALAKLRKQLIVFIDALDQLSDSEHARNLSWLPDELPANVKLIVSTLPGECYEVLRKKLPVDNLCELKQMETEEGEKLLDVWLENADRTLQSRQRQEVLGNFNRADNRNPLYLKLAFEEARRWNSYTKEEAIKLSPDISGIIRNLFSRLSQKENHGAMMVSRSLGYLAAAKNGLSEDELLDVLSSDEEFFRNFLERAFHKPPENRLPIIVWSRLYFDLEPYLIERSADNASLIAFYHQCFKKEVISEYLERKDRSERHKYLADYFLLQPLRYEQDGNKIVNSRKLSELPFQLTECKRWEDLSKVLVDPEFFLSINLFGDKYELMRYCTTLRSALIKEKSAFEFTNLGSLFRQTWSEFEKPLNPAAFGSLGAFLLDIGENAAADYFINKEKELIVRNGSDLELQAANLNEQGRMFQAQKNYSVACEKFLQSAEILESLDSVEVATPLSHLADVYREMGRVKEAVSILEKALEIRKRSKGERSPEFATSLQSMANLLSECGKFNEAFDKHSTAFEIRREKLGKNHRDVGISLYNMANMCCALGRYHEARNYLHRSKDIFNSVLGSSSVESLTVDTLSDKLDSLIMNAISSPADFGIVLLAWNDDAKFQKRIATHLTNLSDDSLKINNSVPILVFSFPSSRDSIPSVLEKNDWFGLYKNNCDYISVAPVSNQLDISALASLAKIPGQITQWAEKYKLDSLMVIPIDNMGSRIDPALIKYVRECPAPLLVEMVSANVTTGPLFGLKKGKPGFMPTRAYSGKYTPLNEDWIATGTFYIDINKIRSILSSGLGREFKGQLDQWIIKFLRDVSFSIVDDERNAFEEAFCNLVSLLGSKQVKMPPSRVIQE